MAAKLLISSNAGKIREAPETMLSPVKDSSFQLRRAQLHRTVYRMLLVLFTTALVASVACGVGSLAKDLTPVTGRFGLIDYVQHFQPAHSLGDVPLDHVANAVAQHRHADRC